MSDNVLVIPRHIGIIMDGNGRWAKARGQKRTFGHRAGVKALKKIIKHCGDLGIEYVTVYAFSTENFKRSQEEVGALMMLLSEFLRNDIARIIKSDVRINVIGDVTMFSNTVQEDIKYAMESSAHCKTMVLNIALAYGARNEIERAVKNIVTMVLQGDIKCDDINQELISNNLYTAGQPDPDLIIRTSGEQRLSNFLLYQAAYSEFYFSPVMWPDFTPEELDKAIAEYNNRERRYGGV